MEIKHKLYSEVQTFKDDLRPKYIIPTLLKNGTITDEESEKILDKENPPDQVDVLLSILWHKPLWELKNFIKALEKDENGESTYPWLAKKLETACNLNENVYQILVNGDVPFSTNHLLLREEKLKEIHDLLIKASDVVASRRKRCWVVLYGPIGSGKSELAAEVVRNNDLIEQHFRHGVYWLSVCRIKDDKAIKLKIKLLFKLMNIKYDFHPDDTIKHLTYLLKKEIGSKKILLILDGVCSADVIKAFDIGCLILVTTNDLSALDKCYCLKNKCENNLKNVEIYRILSNYVGCEIHQLPTVVEKICSKCEGSPLVASLIGIYMADSGNNEKKWEHLYDKLEKQGTRTLRKHFKPEEEEDGCENIGEIINLNLESIQHLKDYYLDFLIFFKDIPVSHQVLEILWDKNYFETLEIMSQLNKRCFVDMHMSEEDEYSFFYTSHDLYLDELADHIKEDEIQKRHEKLVKKILELCTLPDGSRNWTKLPESYIPSTIGYHLYKAGEHGLLKTFYTDLKFLEQIIHFTDVQHMILEYDRYESCFKNEEVEMFESFLRRNAFALSDANNDIIQLALFEPADSLVYKKAKDYAEKKSKGKYFDWSNKNGQLFHYKEKICFKVMRHAVFNHNASLVACVGDTIVEVWKPSVLDESQILYGHSGVVNYCSFNSNGEYLATASDDKTVRIFRIGTSFTSSEEKKLHSKKKSSIPNFQQNQNAQLHDYPEKEDSLIVFTDHKHNVLCCSYSPDDRFVISSDSNGTTYVWEVGTKINELPWIIIHYIKHHKPLSLCFSCFSNDGKTFGISINDSIILYDFETGNPKKEFSQNNNFFQSLIFTPDDRHILSFYDNVIFKWSVENGMETSIIDACPDKSYVICCCCISPDGNFIACGTSVPSVIIINARSQNFVKYFRGNYEYVISVMFSKDNRKLLALSSNKCIIHDLSELNDTHQYAFEGNLSVQMQKSKQEITVATSVLFNSIEVREGLNYNLISKAQSEKEKITFCSLCKNCSEVVYGTESGYVKVFNVSSKSTLELPEKHSDQVNYILHSKNNSTFFTCSMDKSIKVWDNNSNILTLTGHRHDVTMCVEFQKSSKLLSCSKDGSLRVWDISSESNVQSLSIMEGHGNQDVTFCDVCPDDVYLASSSVDGTVKVWKAENGDLLCSFFLEDGDNNRSVRCCKFSTYSKCLMVGLDNGKVFLCEFRGNQEARELATCHDFGVHRILMVSKDCIKLEPDGPLFLSMSKSIKFWSHMGQPLHTILLPSSFMGDAPPCIWTSETFDIIVVLLNSILYILKRI
ncbi:unnamed protein product [Larinioides sclopetarius]|uniref:Apoptotic protease-activating factor 1 n=1 Tax=Larinioides sclopetarius TaxID=280406 RepID=A0AAV2BG81_9ARAC